MSGDADAQLRRLLDEEATAQAARARERSRWLRQQASEERTFAGLLAACREVGARVQIHTVAGIRHDGVLQAVGPDWCQLDGSWRTYVALSGIVALHAPVVAAADNESPSQAPRLSELLTELAPERPQVRLQLVDATVDGTLVAGGLDVLSVQPPGGAPATYVPLAAVVAISVRPL
ncbi:MAG: hypothetical protein ACR2MA_03975 [Egibacteraceae bacterium]